MIDANPVNGPGTSLQRAMGQLETRIQQLEQSTSLGGHGLAAGRELVGSSAENGNEPAARANGTRDSNVATANGQEKIAALLAQGQARLKVNDWEEALKYFDEVLGLDPHHSQALVKKGAALERLKRLDEAFECYDQAIAADDSLAIAYLHKGGLCSRLERFKEALECYEKALRTHTEWERAEQRMLQK
jgi:tetratricopeptide (TPR) repeat protein